MLKPVDEAVVAWLLEGDAAVRFQTQCDLLHRDDPKLQERIAQEGHGAALLAARGPDGHWGQGFYRPKWTCSHYTLLELKNLGLSRDNAAARHAVAFILATELGRDGGLGGGKDGTRSDACITGMTLNYASYFGAAEQPLVALVDFLLDNRLADGGFNCRLNRSGAQHSSMHTTICVMEGITEYERSGHQYRLPELATAYAESAEFLLRHRLFRSERTGEVIDPHFARAHHPARWHYDVLRGLDALADAGIAHDPRMDDALDLIESLRGDDGRWLATRPYGGATHVPPTRAGRPEPWITLIALRVLGTLSR
jgi:hypothetical protein